MNELRKYINIVEGKLNEKHYFGSLYHTTDIHSAYNIVENRTFYLTEEGQDGAYFSPNRIKGYEYYLSTSRDKFNGFRKNGLNNNQFFTFILDTLFYKNKGYKITPVNWLYDPRSNIPYKSETRNEAEERIWSKTYELPAKILEIHIYIGNYDAYDDEFEHIRDGFLSSNIPCYLYQDEKDYLNINKNKADTDLDEYFRMYGDE